MAKTSTELAMCTEETTRIRDLEREVWRLQRLLWECHHAASDGIPVPFERWLADDGPDGMPADVRELREAYDTVSEHEHRLRKHLERYRHPDDVARIALGTDENCNDEESDCG